MIGFASSDDYTGIIALWNICFGDDESYIMEFLDNLLTPENCLVYTENSEICAMMFILKGDLFTCGNRYSSFYIYAACTKPEYRNRGFMSRLIEFAIEYANTTKIDFICLVPANDHLFDYYSNLGFERAFKRKEFELDRAILDQISDKNSTACSPNTADIKMVRDKSFALIDYFSWDEDVVNYSIEENKRTGGTAVFAKQNGDLVGYAIYTEFDGKVIIKEFCAASGYVGSVINVLVKSATENKFYFSIPVDFPISSDNLSIRDNGMVYAVSKKAEKALSLIKNAYIGLTLE